MVLRALTESKIHHGTRKPLQHLVLDATFLGDHGIEQLAELFETEDTFFEHLQTLVVRNNFMGETGCRALLETIESFDELQTLDLSRNILTDTDAFALADLLDDPVTDMNLYDSKKTSSNDSEQFNVLGLAGLRTLKLQENFITSDGFHAITIALCSREGYVATVGDATDHSEHDEFDEDEEEDEEIEGVDVDQED
ncbi:Hypothetical protein PHPALM_12162 [Phytophthora palmivora]|uniref:Myosin-like protein n=1 Tax=Phytophthora palmivora TaxID=4796 RepID=A0A2P4Y0E9_9STRA|nr:Hypothetical protein PHPALM_12162 [Phytophthora palmivora]